MKLSWRQTIVPVALLSAACVVVSLLLGWTAFARRINLNFYDLYFRQRGAIAQAELDRDGIVLVAIDDATLARYGASPLNRARLAEGVRRIAAAQPKLLAIDILLVDKAVEADDAALEAALGGMRPLVLSSALEAGTGTGWLKPLPRFAQSAARVGHVHADPDGDGVSRQVLLSKYSGRERYWAFALEALNALRDPATGEHEPISDKPITETTEALEVAGESGTYVIPAPDTTQRTLWINYAGPDGTFPRVSFARLLEDPAAGAALRGRIVLLGVTAQGTGDRLFTPFFSASGMPGIEIHANILHTLLSGRFLTPVREAGMALAVLLIAALALLALARMQGVALWASLLAVAAAVIVAPYFAFLRGQVWPAFSLLLCFGVAVVAGEAFQLLVVRRRFADSENKRRLARQQFEMATHEMRTPLASIQASSELLTRYTLDPARREQMLKLLHDESQRLAKLVERFLSVERLSAGEMELRLAPIELSPLLTRIAERIGPLAARKGLQFRLEPAPPEMNPTKVQADAELLEFAVSNLLTNAVKYTPAVGSGGGPEGGWVRLAWQTRDGAAEIVVADNGPGIAQPDQKKLFDRFFRTAEAEQSTTPGFGLGLAIAREIISHHGGHIEVASAPGEGTRFTIQIPAH